jgi:microcystin-dependent protein
MHWGGGTTAPVGWLFCDGTVKNQSDFPALYAVVGSKYNTGGEAVGTFRLPDVSVTGKHLWGSASNTLSSTIAQGGANSHSHNASYSVTFGFAANTANVNNLGYHGHNINGINTNGGNAGSYHNHYNLANNTSGSTSNFAAGNGTRAGGSIDSHTHTIVGYIDAGDHYHTHNHNGTNATYSGDHANAYHSLTATSASGNVTFTNNQSLDTFIAGMIIKT